MDFGNSNTGVCFGKDSNVLRFVQMFVVNILCKVHMKLQGETDSISRCMLGVGSSREFR